MTIIDKFGFPVEKIKGKPVVNFIRMIIHGNIRQTFKRHTTQPA